MIERDDDLIERRQFLGAAAAAVASLRGLSVSRLHAALTRLGRLGGPLAVRDSYPVTRPFNMIVLGDSIMWGQGLEDGQKFSTLVKQWVQARLPVGIPVRQEVFAHSGAVIGPDGGDSSLPKTGELATGVPSVAKQMEMAKTRFSQGGVTPDQVDLVLMDGGINDVGVFNILNFDPRHSSGWVGNLTQQFAVERMAALLPKVADSFPTATIIVMGYYRIVSDRSNADPMYSWVSGFGLLPVAYTAKPLFDAYWLTTLHDHWTQNFIAFDTVVRDGQQHVVDDLNRRLRPPAVGAAPVGNNSDGLPAGHNYQPPTPHPAGRIVFVTVPFAPENSYGTSPRDTWLWTYGDQLFAPGVAERRRRDCASDGRTGFDLAACQEASSGHPNIVGARKYADAIIAALAPIVPQWRTRFAAPPAKTLVLRIAPTPRVEVDKADTVTVYASDRATGASVNGTVYVGNDSYPTGVQFQHTFCRRIFDPIKKRRVVDCDGRITVKAPGYTNPQYLLVAIPDELVDSTEPADPNPPR